MASPYSDADRQPVAAAVLAHGTSKRARRLCGIPASTIRYWRTHDELFQQARASAISTWAFPRTCYTLTPDMAWPKS